MREAIEVSEEGPGENQDRRPAMVGRVTTAGQGPEVVKWVTKREYHYGVMGLWAGLIVIVLGAFMFWHGIQGPEGLQWKWGIEMIKPGAGGVLVLVGVIVIWLTRPNLEHK